MNRFFCSSVPYAMIVGPINPSPSEFAMGGASTRAISSQKSDCSISVAPRPPYSLGQETAAQPPSYNFRCQALRYGNDSSNGFSRHSLQSPGTLAANQDRNSSRKAISSDVRFRSIYISPRSLPDPLLRQPACLTLLRRFLFRIFPVPVFGKLSRNSTERGHL